jgi:broad specificity phosphatase PhoE
MGTRTVVHVLRHGEVYNPDHILYGRLPGFRLSPLGEQMAKVSAQHLAGHDVTALRCSPLERTRQTAAPFAEQFDIPATVDDRLIESTNVFEGRTTAPGAGAWRHPRSWRYLWNPFLPSWGEPYAKVAARMFAAVRAARDAAEGHEALCVSHQLPIWALRRFAEGKRLWHDPRRRECALASLTSITFEGDRVVGVGYADPAAALIAQSETAQTERGA